MDRLTEIMREKKAAFLKLKKDDVSWEELEKAGNEYIEAIVQWHKARFPKKRFVRPTLGYLLRVSE